MELPGWWNDLPSGRPLIYVSLGSSGAAELLPKIFQAVADLPVTVLAATAGRFSVTDAPDNVFVAD